MRAKTRNIIIVIIIIVVLAALIAAVFLTGKIPSNDANLSGNTAGNLNNSGYFCESDGVVYFANAYDGYSLYSMNVDETNEPKLNDNPVSSINAGGNYLYYYMESGSTENGFTSVLKVAGVYRSKKNGNGVTCLDQTNAIIMQLCGNSLYYQRYDSHTGTVLCRMQTDKSNQTTVADYAINPASYADGLIYFNGTQTDHALYTLNTANDQITKIWDSNLWNPVYEGGYVYYMDVANNYRLCRYAPSLNQVEVLTSDRIDYFNVCDGYIYYQKSSTTDPALKRMTLSGGNPEVVMNGVFENINITSEYVYFNEYGAATPVYKTSTYGPILVSTFDAARKAAEE